MVPPPFSTAQEKVRSGSFARTFDAERSGAQEVEIFEEGEDSEFLDIFEGKLPTKRPVGVDLKAEIADVAPAEENDFIDLTKSEIQSPSKPEPEPEPVKVEEPVAVSTPEVKKEDIAEEAGVL